MNNEQLRGSKKEPFFYAYLITDPKYYTNNPITFKEVLTKTLTNNQVDIVCFRDKISTNKEELAKIFIEVCKSYGIQHILINSDIELAIKLGATGIHLTSLQFNKIKEVKRTNLFVIISCHTLEELLLAKEYGANMVTYSPIFLTPNKGKPKGCDILAKTVKEVDIPIIALGGIISQNNIKDIQKTKANGFASIRYFLNP